MRMPDQPSLPDAIKQLNALTSAYADETSHTLQGLSQAVQNLVPSSEYKELLKQPAFVQSQISEERLICKLEANRVRFSEEIQAQNTTSASLMDIIVEYEELINALTAYSGDFVKGDHSPKSLDADDLSRELDGVERALDANLSITQQNLGQLVLASRAALEETQQSISGAATSESQQQLLDLIRQLNASVEALIR